MSNPKHFLIALVLAVVAPSHWASAQSLSWTATHDGGLTTAASGVASRGIVVDKDGATYVAGVSVAGIAPEPEGGRGTNGIIVKYGPSGQPIWTRQIEAGILAVLLDEQQQLLVLTTLASYKFGTTGNLLWRTALLFEDHSIFPSAAAVAPGGGIYVAGSTGDNSTGRLDLAVARLDGSGRFVWLRSWNGTLGLNDEAQSAAVDAAGRVYVTGRSQKQESPEAFSYVTVAIDANGVWLWSHPLGLPEYTTRAVLAADPAGGAFVAVPLGPSGGDIRVVKYDPTGGTTWSADFDDNNAFDQTQPEFAAVAPTGALYVAGVGAPSGKPRLVRYSESGAQEWVSVGAGPVLGTADDLLAGFGVDPTGQAIEVRTLLQSGQLRATRYAVSGVVDWSWDLMWTSELRAAGLAVGVNGEIRIASNRSAYPASKALTMALDYGGSLEWAAEPPPVFPDEGAVAVKLDAAGNASVLSVGYSDGQQAFRTLRFGPAGQLVWSRDAFLGFGQPTALAVTATGEVAAAGVIRGGAGDEIGIVKYDANGAELWARSGLPPGFSTVWPGSRVAMALDATGNIYLASRVVGTDVRAAVVKYAPDGGLLWTRTGPYPIADLNPVSPLLSVSPNGNVVIGGSAYSPPSGPSQYHVWALDPAGATVWSTVGGAPSAVSNVAAMAVDAQSNVVIGEFYGGQVVKLSSMGVLLWSSLAGNRVMSLSVDPTGAIAVAGREYGVLGFVASLTKYAPTGTVLWSRRSEGEPFAPSFHVLRSTADGSVYAAGKYYDVALDEQSAFVAAYDASGQLRWARSYGGVDGGPASFNDLDFDGGNRLVGAGYVQNGYTNYDVVVQSIIDDPASPLAFHTVAPCRAFDSREPPSPPSPVPGRPVPGNAPFEAQVAGRCGVPLTARSVALNVTVTSATDAGHVTLFPAGRVPPPTSTINHPAVITRAAQSVVSLGDGGQVAIRAIQPSGSVHVILDVSGYFE